MAAANYYNEPGMAQAKMADNTHLEGYGGQSQHLSQEMGSDTRGYPQQGYQQQSHENMYGNQQQQPTSQQHMSGRDNYSQGGQQQNMGQQQQQHMGGNNYGQQEAHGGGQQQMNGGGGGGGGAAQAAERDNRDTLTKWLDRLEKKFGGDRFNNPENAEKNKALNENILKRLKQVGKMAMQRGPGMLMRVVR